MTMGISLRRSTGLRLAGLLVLVAVLAVALAACSSSARVLSTVGGPVGDTTGGGTTGEAPLAMPSAAASAAADQLLKGQGGSGSLALFKEDAKIVRTGSMELQVDDLAKAVSKARDAIAALGGFMSASTETNGDKPTASITYRIPVDRWEDGLAAIRAVGHKVLGEKTDAVEVTGQLVDLDARIKNLQASESALQAIMKQATKISDILDVQNRLSDVRGQIEQLQAQQALLQDQTAYGTLTVTMGPEVVAVTEAAKQWDPGTEADNATATLISVVQALATAGIWFGIVWLPILLVLGIALLVAAFIARRLGLRPGRGRGEPPTLPTEPPTLPNESAA
ncbi:MAG TPA: DUF4349 domain-containing protein [Candidatus Dormibacteraeota bacterium]|nr:DUF4349 domain-containing protein [Candidatus Dormibacteraeota bacterium]